MFEKTNSIGLKKGYRLIFDPYDLLYVYGGKDTEGRAKLRAWAEMCCVQICLWVSRIPV